MEKSVIKNLISLTSSLVEHKYLWSSYDEEADTLYIDFEKPSHADDSELTDDDIIIRYNEGRIVGITVLNAKKRKIA
jgi:uncharacterized protein YuzE